MATARERVVPMTGTNGSLIATLIGSVHGTVLVFLIKSIRTMVQGPRHRLQIMHLEIYWVFKLPVGSVPAALIRWEFRTSLAANGFCGLYEKCVIKG